MTAPERLTEQLDAALANYTAGIDRAVRFVTIDQVDMLAEFYLQNRRADLATVPAQVRVNPLVWVGDGHWHSGDNEGWLEEANTPFGWGYAVEFGTLETGPWKVSSTFGSDIVKFDTPSAAKAAAQADYESRILAALAAAKAVLK